MSIIGNPSREWKSELGTSNFQFGRGKRRFYLTSFPMALSASRRQSVLTGNLKAYKKYNVLQKEARVSEPFMVKTYGTSIEDGMRQGFKSNDSEHSVENISKRIEGP